MPTVLGRDSEHGRVVEIDLADYGSGAPHNHDAAYEPTGAVATHAATPHAGAHPDLAAHTTLGLSAAHAHDFAASGHTHDTSHNHDAAYEAAGAVSTHAGAADPHTGYLLEAAHGAHLSLGTSAGTAAEGNHSHPGGAEAFPVGAVFLSVVATDPATLLGYGTWSQIAQGQFLVGQSGADAAFDTAEETGGAQNHTHATHGSAGDHSHASHSGTRKGGTSNPATILDGTHSHDTQGAHTHDAHETVTHLPPYLVVYVWKRTA